MKKKILSFLCCFALMFICLFTVTGCDKAETKAEIWDGTAISVSKATKGVIKIETAEELAGLAKSVNEGNDYAGVTIKLTCDIDLNNHEWTPIGFGSSNIYGYLDNEDYRWFKGTFDGQNHTISNLKITTFTGGGYEDPEASSGVALFGHTYDATIKNLTVETATVRGNHFVAVIAGFTCGTKIENVHVTKSNVNCTFKDLNDSGDKASTIVAFIRNSSTCDTYVKNCSAKISVVQADRDAGQIIGCFEKLATSSTSYTEQDNTATDVLVSWNSTGATPNKSCTNIRNDIIGRDER